MPQLLRKKVKETDCYRYIRAQVRLSSGSRLVRLFESWLTGFEFEVLVSRLVILALVRRYAAASVVLVVDVQCLRQEALKFRNP